MNFHSLFTNLNRNRVADSEHHIIIIIQLFPKLSRSIRITSFLPILSSYSQCLPYVVLI
jgi:hypothetical protein